MDMNTAHIPVIQKYLPEVDIVFDHYHVTALINKAIDELRREQQSHLDQMGRKTLSCYRTTRNWTMKNRTGSILFSKPIVPCSPCIR